MVFMKYTIIDIAEEPGYRSTAAKILMETFMDKGISAWPDMPSAMQEVDECVAKPNICIGLLLGDVLAGWVGLRPLYKKTWELHPLVVVPHHQGKGIGRVLVRELEKKARASGIIGVVLGTDDEHHKTSISQVQITEENIFEEMKKISNINRHPYEFYKKCGYMIVGIVPNANGMNKPDIWMWKNLA